jgi:arylsulfatase A-like enzyme
MMAVLAASAALAALVASAAASAPPHLLLMLGDDLGNYEVGFHNPLAITPHIDARARDGVVLERHYVYHCCGPTRTSLMTGRLPYHGNQHNGNDLNSTDGADLRMTFLPAKLKQAGYRTSMIGKSHLGARSTSHLPIHRGFDQHFGFLGGGEDHYTQVSNEDPVVGELVDLWRDHAPAIGENGTFSGYLYSREAQRVIKTHAATYGAAHPLFMYLAWHLVHAPLEAPTHYFDPTCADSPHRQLYHGMVTALDESVGVIVDSLKSAALYDNTVIVYSSDNGGPARESNNMP